MIAFRLRNISYRARAVYRVSTYRIGTADISCDVRRRRKLPKTPGKCDLCGGRAICLRRDISYGHDMPYGTIYFARRNVKEEICFGKFQLEKLTLGLAEKLTAALSLSTKRRFVLLLQGQVIAVGKFAHEQLDEVDQSAPSEATKC